MIPSQKSGTEMPTRLMPCAALSARARAARRASTPSGIANTIASTSAIARELDRDRQPVEQQVADRRVAR